MKYEIVEDMLCLSMNLRLMQEYLLEIGEAVQKNGTGSIRSLEEPLLWVEKIEMKEG